MKSHWLFIALLAAIRLHALQGATPQAALEEIATATKPEAIVRHLPEPVQKKIDVLPRMEKQLVLDYLLKLKTAHLGSCTVRPEQDSDGWEILDSDGNHKGKVTLANAFISGTDAMLPLQVETGDNLQMFIVTMHLEEDEWRIDDFGEWEKNDLGLAKLLHQPTAMEKNEATARQTLGIMMNAIRFYANVHPRIGFPAAIRDVVQSQVKRNEWGPLLDDSFAADPLIKDGYRFRYLRTAIGSGNQDYGSFEITAMPVEFGSTGSKSYFVDESGLIHATSENRPAAEDDPRPMINPVADGILLGLADFRIPVAAKKKAPTWGAFKA